MALYQVRVDIYEPGTSFPIVTHLFTAKTKRRAWGYHDAHRKSDRFLRECENKGLFGGEVACRVEISERWTR